MNTSILLAILPLVGVIIGGFLTFLTQYLLHRQQEKSEIRKRIIELKNKQCLALWDILSDTYQYLYFSGRYAKEKIDWKKLGEHIKLLNVAIIKVEPFIDHRNFLQLMEVRDTVNTFFVELEDGDARSYDKHMDFITKFEEPMDKARDVLRKELQLVSFDLPQA